MIFKKCVLSLCIELQSERGNWKTQFQGFIGCSWASAVTSESYTLVSPELLASQALIIIVEFHILTVGSTYSDIIYFTKENVRYTENTAFAYILNIDTS